MFGRNEQCDLMTTNPVRDLILVEPISGSSLTGFFSIRAFAHSRFRASHPFPYPQNQLLRALNELQRVLSILVYMLRYFVIIRLNHLLQEKIKLFSILAAGFLEEKQDSALEQLLYLCTFKSSIE